MSDGLFQGNNLSSLIFCLGLRRALRRFQELATLADPDASKPLHLQYIDVLIMKFHPSRDRVLSPLLERALLTVNLKLDHRKCKVLIPSADEGVLHDGIAAMGLHEVHKSIDLLGGAIEGKFCAMIGACTSSVPPSA